jgi:hypothetical protein
MSKPELRTKEAEANAARERFISTLHELQHRLSPKTIANDVKERAKEKADGAISAARDGVNQAATHPSTVAAVATPIVLYLLRKPLTRGLKALFRRTPAEQPALQPYEAVRHPPALPTEPLPTPQRVTAEQGA